MDGCAYGQTDGCNPYRLMHVCMDRSTYSYSETELDHCIFKWTEDGLVDDYEDGSDGTLLNDSITTVYVV
jgi:hypothetical protein